MKLKKLLKDIPVQIKGNKDLDITGVCSNSKRIAPGNIFIARKGLTHDGTKYIPEAVAAGAVAIVTDIFDPLLHKDITQIIHPNVASIEGLISAHYYEFASDALFMVGITGTNGKTTTSFLIKHILDSLSGTCGLIGTIENISGQHRYKSTLTTPDVTTIHKMLRDIVNQGCKNAVMEVTSHALDQNRVDQIDFDVAVFTNFTQDHLDYHQTMEKYAAAKNKLFRSLQPEKLKQAHALGKLAIVNIDSPWHTQMLEGCKAPVLTYGIENPTADLKAENIVLTPTGTSLLINYKGQKISLDWPLVGRFNAYNCLAAVGVAICKGLALVDICKVLERAPAVPGRLEAVPNPLGLKIYVDFAHSDDALLNVFKCLQEFKIGRIITVFGCGGNRDATKRPKMARVCEHYSDFSIVTTDNPRNEDPQAIIQEVITGFLLPDSHCIELDRTLAIEKAIDLVNPNDIILIAGKGHETNQIFSHKTIEFDDRKVALQICQKKSAMTMAVKN